MELSLIIDQMADAIREINTNSTPARRLVGGGVVVDSRLRLLMVYSDFAYQGWHFPKGGLDEGENSLQAAIREVAEESGGVKAKNFSGNIKFELQPGRVYREPIGFGSSRAEAEEGEAAEKISLGAYHLLVEAAKEARIDLEELHKHRYAIFDALVEREVPVSWVTVPTYHLLAYESGKAMPTAETQAVEWQPATAIRDMRPPGKGSGKPRLGGATRTLLDWPKFMDLVEAAKAEAKEAS